MLGFVPVEDEAAAAVDPNLRPVNAFLRSYREAWDSHVDAWLVVRVAQPDYAYRWRLQVWALCCPRTAEPPRLALAWGGALGRICA